MDVKAEGSVRVPIVFPRLGSPLVPRPPWSSLGHLVNPQPPAVNPINLTLVSGPHVHRTQDK